jgi:hypothetical protein
MYLSAEEVAKLKGLESVVFKNSKAIQTKTLLAETFGLKHLSTYLFFVAANYFSTECYQVDLCSISSRNGNPWPRKVQIRFRDLIDCLMKASHRSV